MHTRIHIRSHIYIYILSYIIIHPHTHIYIYKSQAVTSPLHSLLIARQCFLSRATRFELLPFARPLCDLKCQSGSNKKKILPRMFKHKGKLSSSSPNRASSCPYCYLVNRRVGQEKLPVFWENSELQLSVPDKQTSIASEPEQPSHIGRRTFWKTIGLFSGCLAKSAAGARRRSTLQSVSGYEGQGCVQCISECQGPAWQFAHKKPKWCQETKNLAYENSSVLPLETSTSCLSNHQAQLNHPEFQFWTFLPCQKDGRPGPTGYICDRKAVLGALPSTPALH